MEQVAVQRFSALDQGDRPDLRRRRPGISADGIVKRADRRWLSKEPPLSMTPLLTALFTAPAVGDLIQDPGHLPHRAAKGRWDRDFRILHTKLCDLGLCSPKSDQGLPVSCRARQSFVGFGRNWAKNAQFAVENPKIEVSLALGGPRRQADRGASLTTLFGQPS